MVSLFLSGLRVFDFSGFTVAKKGPEVADYIGNREQNNDSHYINKVVENFANGRNVRVTKCIVALASKAC